ncbi:MAG: homocysteine S-methyltransferase family protein, partial [Chloroflexi bacterium]|nr:homocysteine S-methyltransferase family protein [Chloroflexota bacterium]
MPLSFTERLAHGPLLCDGAMGTQLYERGVEDDPLDLANLTHPDVVKAVHLDYLRAGAEVIQTNTFGANALRLAAAGVEGQVEEINRAAVAIAEQARRLVGQRIWIAGGIGPLGRDSSPFGALDSATGHNAFAQQAAALADAGVDLFMLETFSSLAEVKLAVAAVRSVSPLPIVAQMTFDAEGVTPGGDTPEEVAEALGELDLAAFGANCSVGPDLIRDVVERMARVAELPISAQPNAGLPAYVDGRIEYSADPAYFSDAARQIAVAGARLLGGCCGTTPEHIAKLRDALRGVETLDGPSAGRPAAVAKPARSAAAPEPSATGLAELLAAGEFVVT